MIYFVKENHSFFDAQSINNCTPLRVNLESRLLNLAWCLFTLALLLPCCWQLLKGLLLNNERPLCANLLLDVGGMLPQKLRQKLRVSNLSEVLVLK